MRYCGILMPIFSLPSKYGIGTLGKAAYDFVDFLNNSGQSVWQILPICPTSYGDSPYQSFSSFAGNPYFIDLDMLQRDGLLKKDEYENVDFSSDSRRVDYGLLYKNRYGVLRLAFSRFIADPPEYYSGFCTENAWWLEDYALFMALKDKNDGEPWCEWESGAMRRSPDAVAEYRVKLREDIEFHRVLQYLFMKQWSALKWYANKNGVQIMGDMPIYVAYDSADVWANPGQFELDKMMTPTEVAGCPPDAFSKDGQLWGNPLYDWDKMREDGFKFWKARVSHALRLYDILRIDHFRGFESYYSIPFGEATARFGRWRRGPGIQLFNELKKTLGELPIVAEDLGYLTEDVRRLLHECGFPGMKVLEFAFDMREDSDYLPHNYDKNCVVYTGTHDNDTLAGWEKSASPEDVLLAKRYIRCSESEGFCWAMIKTAMASVADTVIIPIQDYIGAGSEARINIPSTPSGNWQWRIDGGCLNEWLADMIYETSKLYHRVPKKNDTEVRCDSQKLS